jgi:hypothetical protein
MSHTKSVSMLVSANARSIADSLMEAMGRGPGTFGVEVPRWESDEPRPEPATHYGAHSFDDELAAILLSQTLPEGIEWKRYGLTTEEAQQALGAIEFTIANNQKAADNFATCCANIEGHPEAEPKPEAGLLSRMWSAVVGAFTTSDIEGQI